MCNNVNCEWNGGTEIDIDAPAIANTGLIDTGVLTVDLDFVVVLAGGVDFTYVPTASPPNLQWKLWQ